MDQASSRSNGITEIVAVEALNLERTQDFKNETKTQVSKYELEIEQLESEKLNAQRVLSERLGEFGFGYSAEEHNFYRLLLGDPKPEKEEYDGKPDVQPPITPPSKSDESVKKVKLIDKYDQVIDIVLWIASIGVGAMLGYGIGLFVGFDVRASQVAMWSSFVFGIALLASLKGALQQINYYFHSNRVHLWAPVLLTACFVIAEMLLGGYTLHAYSINNVENEKDAVPVWLCCIIALCVATPTLVYSAVKGWRNAKVREVEGRSALEYAEAHRDELISAQREYESKLKERDVIAAERYRAALVRFEETNEKFERDPRWQSVLSLFSLIDILKVEIERREEHLKSYKHARGYERYSQGLQP